MDTYLSIYGGLQILSLGLGARIFRSLPKTSPTYLQETWKYLEESTLLFALWKRIYGFGFLVIILLFHCMMGEIAPKCQGVLK